MSETRVTTVTMNAQARHDGHHYTFLMRKNTDTIHVQRDGSYFVSIELPRGSWHPGNFETECNDWLEKHLGRSLCDAPFDKDRPYEYRCQLPFPHPLDFQRRHRYETDKVRITWEVE